MKVRFFFSEVSSLIPGPLGYFVINISIKKKKKSIVFWTRLTNNSGEVQIYLKWQTLNLKC